MRMKQKGNSTIASSVYLVVFVEGRMYLLVLAQMSTCVNGDDECMVSAIQMQYKS